MIGAMPAVAVRHERRKQKKSVFGGILPERIRGRPTQLNIKSKKDAHHPHHHSPLTSQTPSPCLSGQNSRAASPSPPHDPTHATTYYRYGDECCYGKISLLHFIIFFLLSGLTSIIVGAVQFKEEAGLSYLRYHFLFVGALLLTVGIVLMIVKCIWFRYPFPITAYIEDEGLSPQNNESKKVCKEDAASHSAGVKELRKLAAKEKSSHPATSKKPEQKKESEVTIVNSNSKSSSSSSDRTKTSLAPSPSKNTTSSSNTSKTKKLNLV